MECVREAMAKPREFIGDFLGLVLIGGAILSMLFAGSGTVR